MSDTELKICPFCGSSDCTQDAWSVKCIDCGAEMPGDVDRARNAWNRRQSDFDARIRSAIERKAEPVGYVSKYGLDDVAEGRMAHIAPAGTFRPENEIPLYSTPPAEPVRVPEKMIDAAARVLNKRLAEDNGLHGVSRDMIEADLDGGFVVTFETGKVYGVHSVALSAAPEPGDEQC